MMLLPTSYTAPQYERVRLPGVNDIINHLSPSENTVPATLQQQQLQQQQVQQTMLQQHQQFQNQLQQQQAMVTATGWGQHTILVPSEELQQFHQHSNFAQPQLTSTHPFAFQRGFPSQQHSGSRHSSAWTRDDDQLLRYLKEVKNFGWREISLYFPRRTANGCQFRWRRIAALDRNRQAVAILKKKDELKLQEVPQSRLEDRLESSSARSRATSLDNILN